MLAFSVVESWVSSMVSVQCPKSIHWNPKNLSRLKGFDQGDEVNTPHKSFDNPLRQSRTYYTYRYLTTLTTYQITETPCSSGIEWSGHLICALV